MQALFHMCVEGSLPKLSRPWCACQYLLRLRWTEDSRTKGSQRYRVRQGHCTAQGALSLCYLNITISIHSLATEADTHVASMPISTTIPFSWRTIRFIPQHS